MPQTKILRRLPAEMREEVSRLWEQGYTLDEILAQLRALGAMVSRAALGRYTQDLDALSERLQRSRIIAEALVARYGDAAEEGRSLRLNVELAHELVLRLLGGEEGQPVDLGPKEAALLASALNSLVRASKADAELHVQLKQLALKEAAGHVRRAGGARGLSQEAIRTVEELLQEA